jgi:uncharacterized protein YhaN
VLEERDRIMLENLRDLSRAQLEHKVERLAERIERYPAERGSDAQLPADFDAAEAHLRAAVEHRRAAQRTAVEAEKAHHTVQAKLTGFEREVAEQTARTEQQAGQLRADEESLDIARAEMPDAELAQAEETRGAALREIIVEVAAARRALEAANPEGVRLQAENAVHVVEAAERRMDEAKHRRIEVRARLEIAGEKGLSEARAEAESSLRRAASNRAALERRAAAARLLYQTFRSKRDEARAAYVGPLTERIQELGRHVFGTDFRVELDDTLAVARRTLNGRTVPFASLSGGAREQISILARLACALTVAEDGGVPLIFDDALGNSDSTRLEAIGAVLSLVGRSCQVIVLTCAPERYRHVGSAQIVRITEHTSGPASH